MGGGSDHPLRRSHSPQRRPRWQYRGYEGEILFESRNEEANLD